MTLDKIDYSNMNENVFTTKGNYLKKFLHQWKSSSATTYPRHGILTIKPQVT